jgi:hypothetical protein
MGSNEMGSKKTTPCIRCRGSFSCVMKLRLSSTKDWVLTFKHTHPRITPPLNYLAHNMRAKELALQ